MNPQCIESVNVNEERSRPSPRKSVSPLKEGFVDEREFNKVRLLNSKLFKDNEKMSLKGKELSSKIYQFYKINKGLNEVIIIQDLQRLNDRFSRDF